MLSQEPKIFYDLFTHVENKCYRSEHVASAQAAEQKSEAG